jgi:hypothetical protein
MARNKERGDTLIDDETGLRALYPAPGERALRKQMAALDRHALRVVSLSPFVVLSTSDARGRHDASPDGGAPGFVHAVDIEEVHLDCGRVLVRTKLSSDAARAELAVLPAVGRAISDQTGSSAPVESQPEVLARHAKDL